MWGRLGPRFALEAGFLILLAVGLGLADKDWVVILAVMGAGWVLVSLIELIASRRPPWSYDARAVCSAPSRSELSLSCPASASPPAARSPTARRGRRWVRCLRREGAGIRRSPRPTAARSPTMERPTAVTSSRAGATASPTRYCPVTR